MIKRDIKLSSEFKTQTTKAIISIVFFAIAYILLLVFAAGLTAFCVYGGIALIVEHPGLMTLVLGIGLASLGTLVVIFLLKFLFKSHKIDRSHLYEIHKKDESKLFKLIQEIVEEVDTSFPKKVYLSSDVNAAVFYDSSFWSMFFPIKKNLQIGLGLVNTVTKMELKAILAHEFGHFSQKTMKVGSYVYNVNQVIFNMLYDNESYDKIIQGWAGISGYFSIFVWVAIQIVTAIQWILRSLYGIVNKSYMGLSREMEFHADEIAANVTGFEPLKSSLLRLSLAGNAFESVLAFYEGKIVENVKSDNVYKEQSFVINFLATDSQIPIVNNLPNVTIEEINKFKKSRLIIKDQWASHPSIEERIKRLEETNIKTKGDSAISANEIFKNIEETQRKLTIKIFQGIEYEKVASLNPIEAFQAEYKQQFSSNTFSKIYMGYYDHKNPLCFDFTSSNQVDNSITIEDLFSDSQLDLVHSSVAMQNDIETIRQISEKIIPIKTFDYDGKKYKRKECRKILSVLEKELEKSNERIRQNDIKIFNFFKSLEQKQTTVPILEQHYKSFFDYDKCFETRYETYTKLSDAMQFVSFVTPVEQVKINFLEIELIETDLKNGIKELLEDTNFETQITKEVRADFEMYLSQKWNYFGSSSYFDDNLEILYKAMNNYAFLLSNGYFILKSRLLNYQDELIRNTRNEIE